MLRAINNMGPMGVFNTLIVMILFVFALINAWRLYVSKTPQDLNKTGRSINNMLFWGVIIIILACIGTFLGMQSILSAVAPSSAPDISVIIGGLRILMPLLVFSFTSFLCISLVWYIFTGQHRKLLEQSMKEQYASE